ncbi:armadillo-type protein [Naematelia encephala]|uniref:Nucleolar protein 9 n=1 Tax=Naematelia encephala TaxID=71784 RepID=A0A1Y2AL30_9TREE|nr:armadillo-type protein [Naematelia encephala]
MPKEQIRKRGKRKSKKDTEAQHDTHLQAAPTEDYIPLEVEVEVEQPQAGPSGLHPARAAMLAGRRPPRPEATIPNPEEEGQPLEWQRGPGIDTDTPFGILDPDLKGYFRTVEDQIKDWEGVSSAGEEREDRQNFLTSVLAELRGHELQVATDPDTAVVLERLLPSLGDWGRRVIGDAFGDNWETLIRHRFGSHVAQTWFTLAADTLDREARGSFPPQQKSQSEIVDNQGVLPTMMTLITTIITSLLPNLPPLLTNPHASPPIRLLLLVISPHKSLPSLDGTGTDSIRSKRSNKYRKGQDVKGKSIFGDDDGKGKGKGKEAQREVPKEVVAVRKEMREVLMQRISGMEWRGMGVEAVGSAAVQLLLELEVEEGESTKPDSILDHLTEGLVTNLKSSPSPQPYPTNLLTTQTGTRLFETTLRVVPQPIFEKVWELYFVGKTGKLAGHPYANFVVAKGVSRLEKDGIEAVVKECRSVSGGRGLISEFIFVHSTSEIRLS